MPDNKRVLRLPCPVCETRLNLDEQAEYSTCPVCRTQLKIVRDGSVARLEPSIEVAEIGPIQRELSEINKQLRNKDDNYGAGCAVATIAISLIVCIGIIVSGILKSGSLFLGSIIIGIVVLFLVLYLFVGASSRATLPLVHRRQELQTAIQQPPLPSEPENNNPKPQAQG